MTLADDRCRTAPAGWEGICPPTLSGGQDGRSHREALSCQGGLVTTRSSGGQIYIASSRQEILNSNTRHTGSDPEEAVQDSRNSRGGTVPGTCGSSARSPGGARQARRAILTFWWSWSREGASSIISRSSRTWRRPWGGAGWTW